MPRISTQACWGTGCSSKQVCRTASLRLRGLLKAHRGNHSGTITPAAGSSLTHHCVLAQSMTALEKPKQGHLRTSGALNQTISQKLHEKCTKSPRFPISLCHLNLTHFGLRKATSTSSGSPEYPWSCLVPTHAMSFQHLGTHSQHHFQQSSHWGPTYKQVKNHRVLIFSPQSILAHDYGFQVKNSAPTAPKAHWAGGRAHY